MRSSSTLTPPRLQLDRATFSQAPDVSIDFAVMEKAEGVVVLAADFGWSDIGSWKAVAEEFEGDVRGNTSSGEVLMVDCENVMRRQRTDSLPPSD